MPHPTRRPEIARIAKIWPLFFLVWVAANWPGLREAWWFFDDYGTETDPWMRFARGLLNGRPVEGVLFQSFLWDLAPDTPIANIAFRLMQGAAHATAAAIAAGWLMRSTRPGVAVVAILPFLLWPFGAEATLWRSAMAYPFGALLGVLSIAFAEPGRGWARQAAALGFAALAALCNPVSAMIGPVLLLIRWLAQFVAGETPSARSRLSEVAAPALGLLLGALISWWVINHSGYGLVDRAGLVIAPLDKLVFLHGVDTRLLWSPNYPGWLRFAQVGLIAAGLLATLTAVIGPGWKRRLAQAAGIWASIIVARYAPIMVTAESHGSWRVMYLGPLLLSAAWVAIGTRWRDGLPAWACRPVMAAILIACLPISWRNSGEYPLLYHHDMAVARELREFCDREGLASVCVLTWPEHRPRTWFLPALRYTHGESKVSAWNRNWFEQPLVERIAGLKLEQDPAIEAEAAAIWAQQPIGGFRPMRLPGREVVFLCPP